MSEREVSWGDEEVIEETPVVIVEEVKKDKNKSSVSKDLKKEIPIPEWSVDTRGDLPSNGGVVGNDSTNEIVTESTSVNNSNANIRDAAAAVDIPQWPEEDNNNEIPVRGRRDFNERATNSGDKPVASRSPDRKKKNGSGNGGRKGGKLIDDLSSINLPGVDLSKMPAATTKISFKSTSFKDERPVKEKGNNFRQPEANVEWSSEVNVEWSSEKDVEWSVDEQPSVSSEPIKNIPESGIKTSESKPIVKAPPKLSYNQSTRLEDDGWGDEEVNGSVNPAEAENTEDVIEKVSQVKIEDSPTKTSPKKKKKNFESQSIEGTDNKQTSDIQAIPMTQAQPVPLAQSHSAYSAQSGHPAHFYSAASSGSIPPYYPPPGSPPGAAIPGYNPMMMMAPMSYMPSGMMMPIWVTCPFCYHCYMYPPVMPGSGPAPGAMPAVNANNNNNI